MYNKLFAKILDSSIWLEDHATVRVWITFMAVMDEDGFCPFASPTNLAKRAGVSLGEAKAALDKLEGPDEFSSDPTNDGRRVERTGGGWIVLNAEKYRSQVTREEIRRQNKERQQRYRDKKKAVTPERDGVTLERNETTKRNADMGERNGTVTQSVAVSVSEANQEQEQVPSAHKDGKKFALSLIGKLKELEPGALGDLALEIAVRHPRSRLRNWTARNVGQADTVAILEAMEDEAQQTGTDMAEAGRMMLGLLDAWDEIPREKWQYVAAIPKFYKQGDYRLQPNELPGIDPQEGKKAHGKRNSSSRGTEGNAEALRKFLDRANPRTGADDGAAEDAPGGDRAFADELGRGDEPDDDRHADGELCGVTGGSDVLRDRPGLQPGAGRAAVLSAASYPPRIQWPRRNG